MVERKTYRRRPHAIFEFVDDSFRSVEPRSKPSDAEIEDFRMKNLGPKVKCPARHDTVLLHVWSTRLRAKKRKNAVCTCSCEWCEEDYKLFKQYHHLQLASPKDWMRMLGEAERVRFLRHYQTASYCPQCGNKLTIVELVESGCLGCSLGRPPRDDDLGRRLYLDYVG